MHLSLDLEPLWMKQDDNISGSLISFFYSDPIFQYSHIHKFWDVDVILVGGASFSEPQDQKHKNAH